LAGSTLTRDRARLGGLTRAALYDGLTVTAKARATFRESFLTGHTCKVCPPVTIPDDLPQQERQRRADALHSAHYLRVRMARGKKKAQAIPENAA
jgi:hypothetical protein